MSYIKYLFKAAILLLPLFIVSAVTPSLEVKLMCDPRDQSGYSDLVY